MADYQWDFTNPDSIPGWSSTLNGVDVKAMAERILSSVTTAVSEESGAAAEGTIIPNAESTPMESTEDSTPSLRNSTDLPDISTSSIAPPDPDPSHGSDDVAAQNKPFTSISYAAARKRHGSALPS
jgi:hypothetical protein